MIFPPFLSKEETLNFVGNPPVNKLTENLN